MGTQTTILDENERPTTPDPVSLPSRRHVSLTVTAVEDRAATIEHLAKKAKDEGYHRMSRELLADVALLRQDVLPAIREQQEIPLAGFTEARSAIANHISFIVYRALDEKAQKVTPEILVERLANRLEPLLECVYHLGFRVGVTARDDDPTYAIVRACQQAMLQGEAND